MNDREVQKITLGDFVVSVPLELKLSKVRIGLDERLLLFFGKLLTSVIARKNRVTFSKRYETKVGEHILLLGAQSGHTGLEDLDLTWDCDPSDIKDFEAAHLKGKMVNISDESGMLIGWCLSENNSTIHFSLHGKSVPSESTKKTVQGIIESSRYVAAG